MLTLVRPTLAASESSISAGSSMPVLKIPVLIALVGVYQLMVSAGVPERKDMFSNKCIEPIPGPYPLYVVDYKPPGCFKVPKWNPPPPNYCFYLRRNATLFNAGILIIPNPGAQVQAMAALELFMIFSKTSTYPVDVGIWGEGVNAHDIDLPMGIKLSVQFSIPPCLKVGGYDVYSGKQINATTILTTKITIPDIGTVSTVGYGNLSGYVNLKSQNHHLISHTTASGRAGTITSTVSYDFFNYAISPTRYDFYAFIDVQISAMKNGLLVYYEKRHPVFGGGY
ncbi:hypothetical protein FOZ61_001111 [Perkinsus olseni]|uniref:Uncharacterized protein n=2 Tax=Perkinsus olseni TaxID=32597 RepID=A0A7J6KSR9_PEROL|nr:hypothetical protein FOZ61_001111 [Perkinsus olseni]